MNVEEMKTMRGLIDACLAKTNEARLLNEYQDDLRKMLGKENHANEQLRKELDADAEDNNRLREENANLHNQVTELTAERDDARRRLKESVTMLEDVWRDYSQINWKSKADKKRAKEMAKKIKSWSDAKEFHMVQTDKGEWVAK